MQLLHAYGEGKNLIAVTMSNGIKEWCGVFTLEGTDTKEKVNEIMSLSHFNVSKYFYGYDGVANVVEADSPSNSNDVPMILQVRFEGIGALKRFGKDIILKE